MKAVILGAGKGTRLASVAKGRPKILANVAGKPLLSWQLDYLARAGVSEVMLNIHHMAERVLEFLRSHQSHLAVRVSIESKLLGTAGALLQMGDFLDRPFILLYGDVATNAPLRDLMAAHLRASSIATLSYFASDQTEGKGVLSVSEGRVTEFVEKGNPGSGPRLVNAGIYALDPRVTSFVSAGADFGHDVWPSLIAASQPLGAHDISASYVRDVGSPEALEAIEQDLASGDFAW